MTGVAKLRAHLEKSRRVTVLSHQNADPDAVCAALALKSLLREVNPRLRIRIVLPGGVTEASQRILQFFKVRSRLVEHIGRPDLLFIVDASSYAVLGPSEEEFRRFNGKVAVIDHHRPHRAVKRSAWFLDIDESATSTAELVFRLYRRTRAHVSRKVAQMILTGIMFDSGYFSIANASTFKTLSALCEIGASLEKSRVMLQSQMSRSERVARLKAAQRSIIKDLDGWIFVSSQVNSHQASAARALISLGADVTMVQGGGGDGDYRVNFRSSSAFAEETGIHLGNDVAAQLAKIFEGEGGGHDRAAGFNMKKAIQPPERITSEVYRILKHKTSPQGAERRVDASPNQSD